MIPIEDLLAPGRAIESLARRAARGNRAAWRLLAEHLPKVIDAERRWLYPALLHRRPGGANRSALLPFDGEHDHMLELVEHVARETSGTRVGPHASGGPTGAMGRALEALLLRHTRHERRWLETTLASHRPQDESALARFVARCKPVVDDVARLAVAPCVAPHRRPIRAQA